jgi:hypothetical protein
MILVSQERYWGGGNDRSCSFFVSADTVIEFKHVYSFINRFEIRFYLKGLINKSRFDFRIPSTFCQVVKVNNRHIEHVYK